MSDITQAGDAHVSDLPGWSCPARVAGIPAQAGSYGWVGAAAVFIDPDGRLWVAADATPRPAPTHRPCVYVAWTEHGLALHVPPGNYAHIGEGLGERSLRPILVPVAVVLPDAPQLASRRAGRRAHRA